MPSITVGRCESIKPMARLVNLTPHALVVETSDGRITLPSEGSARVVDHAVPDGTLESIDIVSVSFGQLEGLPDPEPGVVYVVSRIAAMASAPRDDLLFPFGEIRDAEGTIVSVSRLARIARP